MASIPLPNPLRTEHHAPDASEALGHLAVPSACGDCRSRGAVHPANGPASVLSSLCLSARLAVHPALRCCCFQCCVSYCRVVGVGIFFLIVRHGYICCSECSVVIIIVFACHAEA